MGWIKLPKPKDVITVIAPIPVVIHDVVVEHKDLSEAVQDAVVSNLAVTNTVVGTVADADNTLTQLESKLVDKVGGDTARNLFLDIKHIAQPADVQTQSQLLENVQKFVETLDFSYLDPFGSFLASELQRARNNFWDKADPIPQDVILSMPEDLAGIAKNSRYILVAAASSLSLPAFAITHLDKASAVSVIDIIFFKSVPGSITADDLSFWAHELTHLLQYKDMGLTGFANKYWHEETKKITEDGHINSLEREADLNACKNFPQGNTHYVSCPA